MNERNFFIGQLRSPAELLVLVCGLCIVLQTVGCRDPDVAGTAIDSLAVVSTESLRERNFGSTITVETRASYRARDSYMASYYSDGLRIYTRIDIPANPPPPEGYPSVIFLHGWAGIDRAPEYDFYFGEHADYAEMIDAYVDAGFVVFVPGWRGHGTVDGEAADGIEFMRAYDNGSYLSPVFYAIDTLNLIDGLQTLKAAPLDLSAINLASHSQGGDVALITLAVAGEGSALRNSLNAASIWSGTFPPRFTQVHTYHAMESSAEAFLAGDGRWNGTATGADGSENRNFVFGYPPDWIETVDRNQWTWQDEVWSKPHVHTAVGFKFGQMYDVVNRLVGDIDDARFEMIVHDDNSFEIDHDSRVANAMSNIGGFDYEQYLSEPLVLHYSDRDFYSFPQWNADLCRRINSSGGRCFDFEYPGNTHALRISSRDWFSGLDAVPGFHRALARDIAVFQAKDPVEVIQPSVLPEHR